MEDNWEPPLRINVSYDAPVQILFKQIKNHDIEVQIAVAANLNGTKREELFDIILTTINDPMLKKNVEIVKDRIETACSIIPGYTLNEVEHYKDIFVNDFSGIIHSSNIEDHINDKIRELQFRHDRLLMDMKDGIRDGAPYTFLEDRQLNQDDIIETLRYKSYLENLLILFDPNSKSIASITEIQSVTDIDNSISARAIGRFCTLVYESGLRKKGNKSIISFCKEVCEAYKIEYSDNVRQWFDKRSGGRYDDEVKSLILPRILPSAAKKINRYLDKKNPPNQKLYA
jgi:hypothetical protein